MINPSKLKHDKLFNRAAITGYAFAILLTVAIGVVFLPKTGWLERRGTASYWLTMLPAAVWSIALVSFSRWAIFLLPFVLGGTPLILAALMLGHLPADNRTLFTYMTIVFVTAVLGAMSLCWLRNSDLRQ